MKILFSIFIAFTLFVIAGCSDDAAPTNGSGGLGGGGNGGGGGGGGNVTMTMGLATDQQGLYYFEFKPSTSVVVSQVVAVCQAAGVNETVPVNDGTVYSNTTPFYLGPINGLQQGQQWQFTVTGKVGSATGANFTSNANFTVQ